LKESIGTPSTDIVVVPQVGRLPFTTSANVQVNPRGISSIEVELDDATIGNADTSAPPVLKSAKLDFNDGEPVVYVTASNVLVDSSGLGSHFEDLIVNFYSGGKVYTGTVVPEMSQQLGDNLYKVAVKPPDTVVLGESSIELVRQQEERRGLALTDVEVVKYKSQRDIELTPQDMDLALVAQVLGDKVSVINAANPEEVLATDGLTSRDLLLARIPVGTDDRRDAPRNIATTSNGTRAYVPLEQSGRVAVIDLMMLRQVDTNPETAQMDPIVLPTGAMPREIIISPDNKFAYISDARFGTVYVLDIDPYSATYNQLSQPINLGSAEIRQLAISQDGKKLFATTPSSTTPGKGQIFVINIDPDDRPQNEAQNLRRWHQLIGAVEADSGTSGIAATPDPTKMVFTNRANDAKGFGLITITNDDPLNFAATTSYAELGLGSINDYFDVNEAVSVVVTPDGKYAFVAGRNGRQFGSGIPSIDAPNAGSNVGIIKDPLTPNARLVAATRPIPMGLTTDLTLSGDGKYLYASYPGVSSVFGFDVEEIIKTVENPGAGSANDLNLIPIDNINPKISLAADLKPSGGSNYGVPEGSNRAPLGLGSNPSGMATASAQDWLDLVGLEFEDQPSTSGDTNTAGEKGKVRLPLEKIIVGVGAIIAGAILLWKFIDSVTDVTQVTLTISASPKGEGLLPGEGNFVERPLPDGLDEDKLKQIRNGVDDYNPNRVMTATWHLVDVRSGLGKWEIAGKVIEELVPNNKFPFIERLNLTAGQTYYWGVEAKSLNHGTIKQFDGEFRLPLQVPSDELATTYSSVSFLTPDGSAFDSNGTRSAKAIADSIVKDIDGEGANGTVMKYVPETGQWEILSGDKGLGKPLVLIADWSKDSAPENYNSGFAEAAADSMFASLITLNRSFGTDDQKDALFNSPIHFVGFGRGAVVNSEIIQRLGTFFPQPKNPEDVNDPHYANKDKFPDLQMTTVDPHDFEQKSLNLSNYYDPQVQAWENVTFADNYYQTATEFNPRGRDIPSVDLSVHLGGYDDAGNLVPYSRAGFTQDVKDSNNPHGRTAAWYGGTTNLSWGKENPFDYPIQRRRGDFSYKELFDPEFPDASMWYKPEHLRTGLTDPTNPLPINPIPGSPEIILPGEGNGTGWYYSVLGGGYNKRDSLLDTNPTRKPVYFDNTYEARMRGDFAVPTVFNGNFDAIKTKMDDQAIPGWSLHNGVSSSEALQKYLVDRKDISTLEGFYQQGVSSSSRQPDYTLRLGSGLNSVTHNAGIIPEWGALRFDLHTPGVGEANSGQLFFTMRPLDSRLSPYTGWINLQKAENRVEADTPVTYDMDRFRIDYGTRGFESFYVNVPEYLREQAAYIDFQLVGTGGSNPTVYLDDVFFQSDALRFGNPTNARTKLEDGSLDNYLIEKPQYTLSYNRTTNTPNWISWTLDQSWVTGGVGRQARKFAEDTNLPNSDFYRLKNDDYNFETQLEQKYSFDQYRSFNWSDKAFFWSDRGHLAASADRQRSVKDNLATFLTTNILPQDSKQNSGIWGAQEEILQDLAEAGYRFNIIAGGYGQGGGDVEYGPLPTDEPPREDRGVKGVTPILRGNPNPNQFATFDAATNNLEKIQVPDALWKVVLGFKPGNTSDVPDYHFAWWVPNNSYSISQLLDYTQPVDYRTDEEKQQGRPPLLGPSHTNRATRDSGFVVSIEALEGRLNRGLQQNEQFDFLRNVSNEQLKKDIRENIIRPFPPSAALMSAESSELNQTFLFSGENTTIGHNRILESTLPKLYFADLSPTQVSAPQGGSSKSHIYQTDIGEDRIRETGVMEAHIADPSALQLHLSQVGSSAVSIVTNRSTAQVSLTQVSPLKYRPADAGFSQAGTLQNSAVEMTLAQLNPREISLLQNYAIQVASDPMNAAISQDDLTQVQSNESPRFPFPAVWGRGLGDREATKVSLSNRIASDEIFKQHFWQHNVSPTDLYKPWQTSPGTAYPFKLSFEITDLPTGQLAEASITGHDSFGHPNSGTLTLDIDGNGLGWFIDSTPWENSEFTQSLTSSAFKATQGSAAFGRYDLLTTILHEMGHLAGMISGNPAFDAHVQTLNGTKLFVGDDFSATLTPDGSHLDSLLYPHDLMNTRLAPGVRKLPSALDLQILQTIWQGEGDQGGQGSQGQTLQAPLRAVPLVGITNGSFDQPAALDWDARGNAQILNSQAVLREDSPLLANFSQTFLIPEHAKTLQFTITGANLDSSTLAPGDTFEAALLDARTLTPLVGTADRLTQTDAFLNLQYTGQSYFSDKVKIAGTQTSGDQIALNTPRTIQVDLTGVTPGTLATLYFDLLGFGSRTGFVAIDNVMILTDDAIAPTATSDSAIVNQGQSIRINVLANDSDPDGTLVPNTLQIGAAPTHGTLAINPDGTFTYKPNDRFVGVDRFTYIVQDNSGALSNEAIVTVTINNLAPTLITVTTDPTLTEGTTALFTATATDPGNDTLTYTWSFGDGSDPVTGRSVTHAYADNGNYTTTLTVTDPYGGSTTQTAIVNVNNAAAIVHAGIDQTLTEGQSLVLNGSYTDPGSRDTHTILWDFGDGTTSTTLTPTHRYTQSGTYTATLTVTDNSGAVAQDSITLIVTNLAPTISSLQGEIQVSEGQLAHFSATAIDPGNDPLTYTWNFGDGSPSVSSAALSVAHTFADNGIYTVTLTVTDDDGGSTSQTQIVNVTNAAAIVDAGANQSSREGQSVTFNGQFTDPGILDTHTVVWNFGDGTSATRVLAPTHVYSDNGVYSVTLTVTDNNGATTTDSLTVTVNNVAPTITNLSGDLLVDEGTTATFIATATDPGSDTLTYTWNFGDGTTATGANVNHRFGDNGTYTVTLSVVDEDGGSTTKTLSVAVANVAPIVEAGTDQIIYADEPLHLNGRFTDPSLLDTHTITWDFGDGTTASGSLTPNHTYTNSGTYTVKLIVTDKDGAVTQDTFTTTVLRPPSLTISDRTVVEGDDGTVTALFTVTLSEASTRPVTVGYTTADGPAIAGTDYSVTNGSLTFTPGQTSQTIAVQVAGDRLDEFDETFFLNLSGVTNATITDAQGMVTIVDNDEAPLLSISDTTVVEGDASLLNVNLNATILATNGQVVIQEGNNGVVYAVFTVSLSAPSAKPITVAFSTADGTTKAGSDYVAVAGTSHP
jgi:PKD repeat protein/DNA/RNA endonuclease G (NUC1)